MGVDLDDVSGLWNVEALGARHQFAVVERVVGDGHGEGSETKMEYIRSLSGEDICLLKINSTHE